MFIARTTNQRGHKWCGLVESDWDPQQQDGASVAPWRCGLVESDWDPQLKKSRKRNIATLTHVPPPVVAAIDAALRQQRDPEAAHAPTAAFAEVQLGETRNHGAVSAVLRMVERLELDKRLARRVQPHRQRVLAMLVQRVLDPGSKLSVERALGSAGDTTVAGRLGVEDVSVDSLYAALDWLADRQPAVERGLAKRHLEDGALVLYDVSSSDFEGEKCPLGIRGYSRDHRPDRPQRVYGLLCTAAGCPVAVSTFPGNTADPVTVLPQVERLRHKYGLRHVVLVGDRGMLTETRIRADVEPAGFDWITALGARSRQRLVADGAVQPSLFDDHGLATVTSDRYPGERLIVCHNPLLGDRRRQDRADLLARAEAHIRTCASMYARGRLGRDACNRRLGKIRTWKMQKHFRFHYDPDTLTLTWTRDEDSIAAEAATDGLYVVRTSVTESGLTAAATVRAYKDLQHVETAFQTFQSVLQVRPIYHYDEKRVRGHRFLCMLAYYVTWHMRQKLRPLLFDDPDPAEDPTPVGPRPRSAAAQRRASRRRTEDDIPLFPFAELLQRLGTLTAAPVRIPTALGTCEVLRLSAPNRVVQRAFELLECPPHPPPAPKVYARPTCT